MDTLHSKGYPGNKQAFGSFQQIINEFPPHTDFISGMAGSGAVEKRKRLAPGKNIVFELCTETIEQHWQDSYGYTIKNIDSVQWYQSQQNGKGRLCYWDVPYMLSARRSGKKYYQFEWTDEQHVYFLNLLKGSKDMHAISHYPCQLYNTMLKGWRLKTWQVMTRQGVVTEGLYMNYKKPVQLHQYDYLGYNRTHRQHIKRQGYNLIAALQNKTREQQIDELRELYRLIEIGNQFLQGSK